MKFANQLFEKVSRLRLALLAVLFAGVLALGGTQTTRAAAATVNYAYTATGWTDQHYGCFTDPRSGTEFAPLDAVSVTNPNAAAISTGDSVTVSFTFDPPLYVHAKATTSLLVDVRMTGPGFNSSGGYPTAAATLSFTGINVVSTAASTFAGTDNFQSNPYTPIIAYGVSGAPGLLIPDTAHDAVVNTLSVAFTAPGGGGSNPDFAGATFVARADIQASSSCPDPGPVLATTAPDAIAPSAAPSQSPAANANGWNNSDVTVTWNWADNAGGSGIDPANCTTASTSSGEGTLTLNATCKDNTGNAGSAFYTVKVDKTAPGISVSAPAAATYSLNQVVAANYSCSDGGAGVASCVGTVSNGANIDTASVGPKTFTVNATDNAGNPNSVTVNYTVAYNFSGFFQPVDNGSVLNVVKAGSAVPVKFSLGGNFGLNIMAANYPASGAVTCSISELPDAIEETVAAGGSSLSYDATTNQYTYVWKTDKAWANTCRQLHVKLNDGTDHVADFKFTN